MDKQFCDKCGKQSNDMHIDNFDIDDYKIEVKFKNENTGNADLCIICKLKILKKIAVKIIKNQVKVESRFNSLGLLF